MLFATAFVTCTKKWEDHDAITDSAVKINLLQAITRTANLGKFTGLLAKSGYDKIISSSKNYTVWAPTDQALQSLDPAIVNDTNRLRQFVGNHITNESYTSGAAPATQRIKMLNGKYIIVTTGKFDSANIVTANRYASNGIFHVIDRYIPRIDNSWEFLNNTAVAPQMKSFLLSLNYGKFDPLKAVQTGVDPATGLPTYQAGTGVVQHNTFLDTVLNVSDEATQYTLFLLSDAAYANEYNKLAPWFVTQNPDSTKRLTGYWLVKDLAFKGALSADQLQDSLTSVSGVKVLINKSAITASYKTSNGYVHVINSLNISPAAKFPPVVIEGESAFPSNLLSYFSADRSANTFYRVMYDSTKLRSITEIFLLNYNLANYNIRYTAPNLNSMRYDVYWTVVNDFGTTWQQRLAIDSASNPTNFLYTVPVKKDFSEVKLGQVTVKNFRNMNLYVIGPATAAASGNTDVIALDYIKLVPAF